MPSRLSYVLTRALRTRAHSYPQHWLLCHVGECPFEFEGLLTNAPLGGNAGSPVAYGTTSLFESDSG